MNSGDDNSRFTLYGTSACHLCEQAEEMLIARRQAGSAFGYSKVDISASDRLFDRYGLVIPVLRHPDGRELGWPFSPDQLAEFVES